MFNSNMLARFYAYNAYEYLFIDETLVLEGVLAGMPPAQANTVYNEPNLGMNSVEKLTFWVEANIGGSSSYAWNFIVTYYAKEGIDMTPYMDQICGKQSILQMIVSNQATTVFNYRPFGQVGTLNEFY
jgi:hypothetical protein